MSEKKHIDQLFKEKLNDLQVTPSDSVWENINTELQQNNNSRKVIPLWLRLSGIVAGLALIYLVGNSVFNDDQNSNETLVDTEIPNSETLEEKQDINDDLLIPKSQSEETIVLEDSQKESSVLNKKDDSASNNENPQNAVVQKSNRLNKSKTSTQLNLSGNEENAIANMVNNTQNEQEEIGENPVKKTENELTGDDNSEEGNAVSTTTNEENNLDPLNETIKEGEDSLTEEVAQLAEENTDELDEQDTEIDRWSVSPNIAPVYFNSLSNGSSIHTQFNNNSKSGSINMSYGISAAYAINDKLSVRAGINKVNLGYSTNDVVVYNNISTPVEENPIKNIAFNETGQNMSFISAQEFAFGQIPGVLSQQIKGSIDQEIGFIEVPLEVAYRVSDKKMGVSIIGGFSALFLDKNEVYSVLDGQSTLLGKATNINKTSYSANLGLGLDFKLSEKFNLNLEPTFKYQLNTFTNTSGNFNPYFVGIYSGLTFKF